MSICMFWGDESRWKNSSSTNGQVRLRPHPSSSPLCAGHRSFWPVLSGADTEAGTDTSLPFWREQTASCRPPLASPRLCPQEEAFRRAALQCLGSGSPQSPAACRESAPEGLQKSSTEDVGRLRLLLLLKSYYDEYLVAMFAMLNIAMFTHTLVNESRHPGLEACVF